MRIFTVLGILFYAIVLILIGIGLIVFSLNILTPELINSLLVYSLEHTNIRVIIGLSGALLILISFAFAQLILGRMEREKTIAFTTPAGQVTIALSAIEDLIRQFAQILPEIRDLKPDVIATKRGLSVNLKVSLRSEANLPELTERLQQITRSKIQEVLGLEEQITIRIHISKIVTRDERDKDRKHKIKDEPTIPFGGFGRA